jgi:hypothetical protein
LSLGVRSAQRSNDGPILMRRNNPACQAGDQAPLYALGLMFLK